MFNPDPRIQALEATPRHHCYVIDDALREPRRWIEHAAANGAAFSDSPHNAFPGPELRLPDEVTAGLEAFFARHLRGRLGGRRTQRAYSRMSLVARDPAQLRPTQSIPHVDRMDVEPGQVIAASVLYLFEDPALGGTSFYRPRRPRDEIVPLLRDAAALDAAAFQARYGIAPGYPDDSAWFGKVLTVPARFNRLIVYPGTVFHAGEIRAPGRLSPDPRRGRLTWNGFFVCRAGAAGTPVRP